MPQGALSVRERDNGSVGAEEESLHEEAWALQCAACAPRSYKRLAAGVPPA